MSTHAPAQSDVIISIYRPHGAHAVATASGPEKSLRLWRNRWVRGGYIARQIDGNGRVREYQPDEY